MTVNKVQNFNNNYQLHFQFWN